MSDINKQYTIEFTEYPEYLHAHLRAETIDPDMIARYVDELVARFEASGHRRILLIRDIPVALSEGLVFHTVSSSLEALAGKKMALVNPHPEIRDTLQFGLTVGRNRGGNYGYFDDIDSALEWLLGK